MKALGKLEHVSPRVVWEDEARDFTPWLAENLKVLGQSLGLDLELTSREAGVGSFSVDLLAKDLKSQRAVVVENQFGATDHDHLGKVLTYASGFDASAVVWLAEEFREEHRQALDWLNQRTDSETSFFGVLIEVLEIDGSKPALSLRPIVYPNPWQKDQRRAADRPMSPKAAKYQEFFQALIDELRERHHFTAARIAQPQNWYSFSSGVSGFQYSFSFALGNRLRTELFISPGDGEENEAALTWLRVHSEALEAAVGVPLTWEPLEGKQACRVAVYKPGSIEDTEQLEEHHRWAIDTLLKLKRAFGPLLKSYAKKRKAEL